MHIIDSGVISSVLTYGVILGSLATNCDEAFSIPKQSFEQKGYNQ